MNNLPAQFEGSRLSPPNTGKFSFLLGLSLGSVLATALTVLLLGATGALAFNLKETVGEALGSVTGITETTLKQVIDPITHQIPLSLLPTGPGSGLDADLIDGLQATSFTLKASFEEFSRSASDKLTSLETTVGGLVTGTLSDLKLSANVALLNASQTFTALKTFANGLTVSGGTVTLPPGSITGSFIADTTINYSKLALSESIRGADLASNLNLSTTGNLTTTGTGLITSAGLLTAGNGFTLSTGTLTLPSASVSDSSLSSNVALLAGAQTFSGAKTFGSAITAPTASNTINGLIISSGNLTLANLTSSTGSLTSTIVDSGTAVGFVLGTSTTYSTVGAKLLQIKNNTAVALTIDKDGNLTAGGNLVATGTVSGTQLISTALTGIAPLVVSSTTQVANLNANYVQGYQASDLYSVPQPNLVPNSDFSRRNKWMTFMPEVFADTSGWTLIEGSSLGSVASNIFTAGNTGAWSARAGLPTWRDGRWSAQFKALQPATNNAEYTLGKNVNAADVRDRVTATYSNGTFYLLKRVSDVQTVLASVVQAATLNNWYWLELEAQGTKYIAKLYSSGASPVAKSSATLLQTLTGDATDSVLAAGYVLLRQEIANSPASQWGGLATGDGGVYVEGWGPESWTVTWAGTLGGQAFGFDEVVDSGPLTKQWTMRAYIPATSRQFYIRNTTPDGSVSTATAYTLSGYWKTSGKGGTGALLSWMASWMNSAQSEMSQTRFDDAGETAWTRASGVKSSTESTVRRVAVTAWLNVGLTATGTAFFMLPQLEQGSVATPWRNAPEDFADLVWLLPFKANPSNWGTTSTSFVEPSATVVEMPSGNLFLPWDAQVQATFHGQGSNDTLGSEIDADVFMDGATMLPSSIGNPHLVISRQMAAAYRHVLHGSVTKTVVSGKHRFAAMFKVSANIGTYFTNEGVWVTIRATKGR